MLNPEVKARWLKALRSKQYKQGSGDLRSSNGDRFCCLGVLCEVYREMTGHGEWKERDGLYDFIGIHGSHQTSVLSDAMKDWAGLTRRDIFELMIRNDGLEGWSQQPFYKIADFIAMDL